MLHRSVILAGLTLGVACSHRSPPPELAAVSVVGVWAGQRDLSPESPPRVTVLHQAGGWTVRAGAHEQPLVAFEGGWRARLDAYQAEVRFAILDPKSSLQAGHWVQPPSPIRSGRYASPLRAVGADGEWSAIVRPLTDEVRLYIAIREDPKDGLRAFMREPNSNYGRRFREMKVVHVADTLRFVTSQGEDAFSGTLDPQGHLVVDIEWLGGRFELSPLGPEDQGGFLARTSTLAPYRYAPPSATADGWPTADLAEVGLRPEPIAALMQDIVAQVPQAWTSPDIHAILVARRGKLVVEEYFHGHGRDIPHDSRSSGKSIASTLLGIAVGQGALSVDAPLASVAEVPASWREDPRKSAITVGHLISMSSGLDCDDNDDNSPGQEDRMQESEDWYAHMLALDSVRAPGEKGVYCSGAINLVGAALSKATKRWIPELFDAEFARPLQISNYHFNLSPKDRGYLAGGLRLRSRDFAKLGQLFLNRGTWKGVRVLPEQWVQDATRAHASVNEPNDYGYGWWKKRYEMGDHTYDAFYASGNGGQLLVVIPELELLVQFNAGNYGNYGTWRRFRDEWVPKYIIAAALVAPEAK